MSWAYRCMKCRGRNTLKSEITGYFGPECRHCGHNRFYLDRRRQWRTDYCNCEGYHYKHRAGSGCCELSPNYEVNVRVGRYGEKLEDVLEDIALREQCPF